jgi:hypothetical protein
MSAMGQKRTWRLQFAMSALPPKADIAERDWNVRFVPQGDIQSIPGAVWMYVTERDFQACYRP